MRFHIEDDSLTIIFQGAEQLWAIRRKLVVPKVNVANVIWQEGVQLPRTELGWRVGGSAIPGVLFAGRFVGREGKNFVYLQHPQGWARQVRVKHVLTIELKGYPYHRLFFTIDQPDIAERIIAWWLGKPS